MPDTVHVGIPTAPYAEEVRRQMLPEGPAVVTDLPALVARRLRQRELAAALLSPTDYARDSSAYRVLPGAAVSAAGPSGPVRLHFRSGLRTITRLAVDPSSSAEIILARILLAEEFESLPVIVPHSGPLEAMLQEADAALVVGGGPAPTKAGLSSHSLDLVEAWQELTDLPYVYGLWCGYERELSEVDARRIQDAHHRAQAEADRLRAESPGHPVTAYHFSGQARVEESVRELLHYVYYHGILPDVPELEYYVFGAAGRSV